MDATPVREGIIVDITTVASSFPARPTPEISRESILAGLEDLLEGELNAVVVEGPEEIGKTTLLAQFVRRNPLSVCLFIKDTSRFTYDPLVVVRDLCNQIQWHITGEELDKEISPDIALFNQLTYQLRGKARRNQSTYFFVIDGLELLAAQDEAAARAIFDPLPFGIPQFKFLVSADEQRFREWTHRKVAFKAFPLTGFNYPETLAFFEPLKLPPEFISEVYGVARNGMPGYMAGVRRLLQSGISPPELLQELPAKLPGIFELEWKPVSSEDRVLRAALCIMAYYPGRHTSDQLADITSCPAAELVGKLQNLSFIALDAVSSVPRYVSESHRRFATQVLASYKSVARDILIEWSLKNPEKESSLLFLPAFLADAERHIELMSFLTNEHLLMMIEKTQSIRASRMNAELGIEAASKLGRDADILRFALQRSAISQLDACEVSKTELEACMALGDNEVALGLAHSAILKHDRLRLLATIGRLQRLRGLPIDPDLLSEIEGLLREVDIEDLGERTVDLATDLMFSQPQFAVRLLEDRARLAPEDRGVDWALAKLSILNAVERQRNSGGFQSTSEDIQRLIRDPEARRFSRAVALVVSKYSARDLIAEVEKMDNANDKMYLLRQWTLHARRRPDILEVVGFALNLAFKAREYTPTARDYLQLSTPLRLIEDAAGIASLISSFDAQRGIAEKLGPLEDYVQLQLALAEAEKRISEEAADKKFSKPTTAWRASLILSCGRRVWHCYYPEYRPWILIRS